MTATLAGHYELIVLDLDGVVYVGTDAVAGAPEAIRAVIDSGTAVVYVTNNASRSPGEVAHLLRSIGVPARAEEILTAARASAQLLAGDLPAGSAVLVVGAPALADEIHAVGLTPVSQAAQKPVAVVQGYGPEVGWADLAEATLAIRAGARWVATNTDATMPSVRGPVPGNGSLVAALRTALGGRAPDTVVGKPEPTMVEVAGRGPDGQRHSLVVGDRLDTDMECAVRAGMDGLLVLTGVTSPTDLLRATPHQRPTHVAAGLTALSGLDEQARMPPWRGVAEAGGWRVGHADDRLTLSRIDGVAENGDAVAALRALAAGAWAHPEWSTIAAEDDASGRVLERLGLTQFAGWSVPRTRRDATAASGA
jgi:glycerol 3-phosphatase-2